MRKGVASSLPEGRQLDYTVGWNFIKVGRAVMLRNLTPLTKKLPVFISPSL